MKRFDLTGKVAIVTGGNGGIGFGMARGLAEAGAAVVVAGRNAAKSEKAVKELTGLGVKAAAVAVDVVKEESCRAMVKQAVERFGRLDILVNNAGMNNRKAPEAYSLAEWHEVVEHQPDQRLPVRAGRLSRDEARRRRQDHQYRLDDLDLRRALRGALCLGQGRHRPALACAGNVVGQGQHPGQRGPAGLDRHRPDARPRASRSKACTSAWWRARPPGAGARRRISPASPHSSPRAPPTS